MILFNLNRLNRSFVLFAQLSRLNGNHLECFVVELMCAWMCMCRYILRLLPIKACMSIMIELHHNNMKSRFEQQIFNFKLTCNKQTAPCECLIIYLSFWNRLEMVRGGHVFIIHCHESISVAINLISLLFSIINHIHA